MSGRTRRQSTSSAASAVVAGCAFRRAARAEPNQAEAALPYRPLDFRPFAEALVRTRADDHRRLDARVRDATVPQLQSDLAAGRYSATELVTYYLHRIRKYDANQLRSVIELNPDALNLAARADAERSLGHQRGPLHGLPILLKDNIGTGDRLHTSAGAAALAAARCDRDAHLVAGLRTAGAVILGKTNLSEWAYWMSYAGPNGFSALGGQVVSPYDEHLDPFGSSTGSAVAATMNLAAATVGTETMGSIVAPSARASVVGMRPTLGLVSRDRIVPISDECDTAGPIGRTVSDVAAVLTAMASERDLEDRHSGRAERVHGTDFLTALDTGALRGKRIGLLGIESAGSASDEWVIGNAGLANSVRAMEAAGARVVVVRPAPFDLEGSGFAAEFNWSFREGVNAYLEATDAPVRTLAGVIAFNDQNPGRYAPWGQDRLRDCLGSPLGQEEAREIARANRRQARDYLNGLLDAEDLDLLAGVDTMQSMIYPFAGFPAIAVPAGAAPWGTPFSVTFIGRPQSDADLIGMAYAFEQASRFRVPPPAPRGADSHSLETGRRPGGTRWTWGFEPS